MFKEYYDIPQKKPHTDPFAHVAATASSSTYASALSVYAATSAFSNNGLYASVASSFAITILYGKLEDNDGDLKPVAIQKQEGESSFI